MTPGQERHHESSRMVKDALNDKQKGDAMKTPDQAEGERDESQKNTLNVGRTPGSAEGDRETIEEDLEEKDQ